MTSELFAGMGEAEFLRAYEATTLRKPQIVSDNVLTGILLADASHRVALAMALLQEAVEAARRLAGVWIALSDRSRPVAQRLAGPLPGPDEWCAFADAVTSASHPSQLLRAMAIDSSALQSAEELVAFPNLGLFDAPVRVFAAGAPAVFLVPTPALLVVGNVDGAGQRIEAGWSLERDNVTSLGDATGYFVTWARDFLGAYIEGRPPQS
jgi:hypothetical protein